MAALLSSSESVKSAVQHRVYSFRDLPSRNEMRIQEDNTTSMNWSDSDDQDDEHHERFLAAVAKLDNRKIVPPSTRKEPSLQVSEFHLSKESDDHAEQVQLWQLAETISQRPSHKHVAQKLKSIQNKNLTLPKPLEKPEANRIQREVGYEDVKTKLKAWEPIVSNNRAADQVVFPLNSSKPQPLPSLQDFLSDKQNATDLEKQIHEILHKDDPPEEPKEEEYSLTLEEMIQRRKELARLRVRESYRHAKAHYQNKIKSKKYHRLARRERIRNQIKEFETLQLKDPEAALQKLDELEKERALERASLRHRSTGKWAQNQAIRAKYDKESRQILSEQLKLSKALTQKVKSDSDSSEEEGETIESNEHSDNPWVSNQTKTESEIQEFLSGYRKFWETKSSLGNGVTEQNAPGDCSEKGSESVNTQKSIKSNVMDPLQKAALENAVVAYSEFHPQPIAHSHQVTSDINILKDYSPAVAVVEARDDSHSLNNTDIAKHSHSSEIVKSTSGKWSVTVINKAKKSEKTNANIKTLFKNLDENLSKEAKRKISKLKRNLRRNKPKPNAFSTQEPQAKSDDGKLLEMKKQRLQIDLDEELHEGATANSSEEAPVGVLPGSTEMDKNRENGKVDKASTHPPELDPNKFISSKPVKLQNLLPTEVSGGDECLDDSDADEQSGSKLLTISEAFADDDVVAEFSQEKEDIIKKNKPEDIDLGLPGWGEWGGHQVRPNKRKRKRFIVKMPEVPPRKDANKGNLIINENEDSAARPHQVRDLPFPFTTVKDFEASIRAPISNTFIPQSAHRRLIKPAVRTKMGAIIEPIDKSVLQKMKDKKFKGGDHLKFNTNKTKKAKRE